MLRHTDPAVWAMVAVLLLQAFLSWRGQPPQPLAADADPDRFSAARAMGQIEYLLEEQRPHPVGSAANHVVRDRIIARLERLGLEPEVQRELGCATYSWVVRCARVENIVAVLPGPEHGPALMLSAHYDSVAAGPGAADDAAGVATLLETARALLRSTARQNPVILLFTDGEEAGTLGAHAFAEHHPLARAVAVVLNLEARGTGGQSAMFETGAGNARLIRALAATLDRPVANAAFFEAFKHMPNGTDVGIFKAAGMAALNFAFAEQLPRYHTPLDDLEHLDAGSVQHHGDNLLALAGHLADADLAALPDSGDAHYLDLAAWKVIYWPARWTPYLAATTLTLLVIAAALMFRFGRLDTPRLAWGLAGTAGLLLAIMAGGAGVTRGLEILRGVPQPWWAWPTPTLVCLWATALAIVAGLAGPAAKRAGVGGMVLAAWLASGLFSLAAAAWLPGAAVLFLVPALPAAVILVLFGLSGRDPEGAASRTIVVVLTLLAALIWLPVAHALSIMFGLSGGIAVTLPAAQILAAGWGLLAGRPVLRQLLLPGFSVLAAIAFVVAARVPVRSPSAPQGLSLVSVTDADRQIGHWMATLHPGGMPASLRHAGAFSRRRGEPYPWLESRHSWIASAEPVKATPPRFDILHDHTDGNDRRLALRLRSPRDAYAMQLWIPQTAHTRALSFPDFNQRVRIGTPVRGYQRFDCLGHCDGIKLTLELDESRDSEFIVLDSTTGLPPSAAPLIHARGDTAVPFRRGDRTEIFQRINLPVPE